MTLRTPLLLLLIGALSLPAGRVIAQDVPEGSPEAVAEFAEGMRLYTAGEYQDALTHLYNAYEMDNNFVIPIFFAALCEGNLASGVPVDSLYQIVLAARDRISPYYIYRAEAQLAMNHGDRDGALSFARKAAYLAPGSKAWYNLAYLLYRMNRPGEARAALLRLDPDKEPMKGWTGYWGELARTNEALGRHQELLQNVADMWEAYPDLRGTFWWEVCAYAGLGDMEGLNRTLEAAGQTPATGAGNTVGAYMVLAAAELKAHGHPSEGSAMYERAAQWYEDGGDAVRGGSHDSWHALALFGAGRYEEALEICDRRLAENPQVIWYNGMAGLASARMGDQARLDRHLQFFLEEAPNHLPYWLPLQMAYFHGVQGRAEEAVAALESAMNHGYAFQAWWHRDPAFDLIRDDPVFQEFIRPKG